MRESQKGQMVGQEDPGSTNLYPFEDFKMFFCKSSGGNIPVEGGQQQIFTIHCSYGVEVLYKRSCQILDVK